MPLNLASPGIVVREVDLTFGRTTPASNKIGAIVAPFAKGPVDVPTLVETEQDLLNNFGEPYSTDKHYEHWLTASSYLSYGGSLRVVRADDGDMKNAYVGAGASVKIKSLENYNQLGYDENIIPGRTFVAQNPGSWANGLTVAIIDAKADQILVGVSTVGLGTDLIQVGFGITQSVNGKIDPGAGSTSVLDGFLKGIITGVSGNRIEVKVLGYVPTNGTEIQKDYQPNGVYAFSEFGDITVHDNITANTSYGSTSYTSELDWFDQQSLGITTATSINWNSVVQRPSTTSFAAARNSRFDEIHVVIVDTEGKITGNAGTILEKWTSLSKAKDAVFSVGSPSYWRKFLAASSRYVFGGSQPAGIVTTGSEVNEFESSTDIGWDQNAEGITFGAIGSQSLILQNGLDYNGQTGLTTTGALTATLAEISDGYDLFENTDNFQIDFLLMGSANYAKENAQALANKLISVAEIRKDAVAFITPHRGAFIADANVGSVTVNSDAEITNEVISFYSPIASSSYAVFDSGYKYMYDRFSDTFRYVPLNGDIAGTCARTDINQFPWFSPAGTARGAILNSVKLAYNPSKSQRDRLYSNRINPVIFSPGAGIILFGDKTGLARASAFDRINVRRLFIYLENTIANASKDVLFEFNDEITRTNFVNTIEPFLRDVQAKRGIQDYVVICDETNNTASVIDNNEFIADIYIKPARSINFIGLTFIATKTGVNFEEVIGTF
jgi:hypothetical protein